MNCESFRKSLEAFVDGELSVPRNLDALEHLKLCLSCSTLVEEQSRLREAVRAVWPVNHGLSGLKERVSVAMEGERRTVDEVPASEGMDPSRVGRLRSRRLVPLGLVAILLFYSAINTFLPSAGWPQWRSQEEQRALLETARLVREIRALHSGASREVREGRLLPMLHREVISESQRLSNHLGLPTSLPDLTGEGLVPWQASECALGGRRAAQLLYRSRSSESALSLFVMPRCLELSADAPGLRQGRLYFMTYDEHPLSVMAWHEGPRTLAGCSDLPQNVLMSVLDRTTIAQSHSPGPSGAVKPTDDPVLATSSKYACQINEKGSWLALVIP